MVETQSFRTGLGSGSEVQLTREQELEAQQFAFGGNLLKQQRLLSLAGIKDPNVRERASFLFNQSRVRGAVVGRDSLRSARIAAIERTKQQSIDFSGKTDAEIRAESRALGLEQRTVDEFGNPVTTDINSPQAGGIQKVGSTADPNVFLFANPADPNVRTFRGREITTGGNTFIQEVPTQTQPRPVFTFSKKADTSTGNEVIGTGETDIFNAEIFGLPSIESTIDLFGTSAFETAKQGGGELPIPPFAIANLISTKIRGKPVFGSPSGEPINEIRDLSQNLITPIPSGEKQQIAKFSAPFFELIPGIDGKKFAETGVQSLDLGKQVAGFSLPTTAPGLTLALTGPQVFGSLSPFLRTGVAAGFGALETERLVSAESLPEKISAGVGIGLSVGAVGLETAPFIRGRFAKAPKTTVLGEKIFENIPVSEPSTVLNTGVLKVKPVESQSGFSNTLARTFEDSIPVDLPTVKTIDLAQIPPGGQAKFGGEKLKPKFKGDVSEVISSASKDLPRRDTPSLPELNKSELSILQSLTPGEEIVSGSLSRNVLLKDQRPFKDIDIISKDPQITAEKILGSQKGLEVIEQPTALTVRRKSTGEELADIVPEKVGEGGFALKFPPTEVEGINFAAPEAILGGKLTALQESTLGARATKSIKDVSQITGGKVDISGPAAKGTAFGFTFEEQLALAGEKVNVGTSAVDFAQNIGVPVELRKDFFGTPSKIGDPVLFRESRVAAGSGFFDTPNPKSELRIQFGGEKSQILVDLNTKIETGRVISAKELKSLARRADAGDTGAENLLLQKISEIKAQNLEGFVPSAQRRGELEVVKTRQSPGDVDVIRKLATVRVRGRAVDVFETSVTGKSGTKPKFSDELKNLLKESSEAGGPKNLQKDVQNKLTERFREETGFDISREIRGVNIVSPTGAFLPSFSSQRITTSFGRRGFFTSRGRKDFGRTDLDFRPTRGTKTPREDRIFADLRNFNFGRRETRRGDRPFRTTTPTTRRPIDPFRTPDDIVKPKAIIRLPDFKLTEGIKRKSSKRKLKRTPSVVALPFNLNIKTGTFSGKSQERTGLDVRGLSGPSKKGSNKIRSLLGL